MYWCVASVVSVGAAVPRGPCRSRPWAIVTTENGEHPDVVILRRLRLRDKGGLDELARDHGSALVRAAYLFLGDAAAADDVAQDAMIAAWDAAPRAGPGTRLRPWLMGILFNRCRKWKRSLWRRFKRERAAAEVRREGEVAEGGEDEAERLEALRRSVRRLDESLREVLILRYERRMSVEECAAALGVPQGTVKSRVHKAVQLLRVYMGAADERRSGRI